MIACQRDKFDMPDDIAYLNCAYMSPLMQSVVTAARRGIDLKIKPWTYTGPDFFTYSEEFRSLAARLVNTHADNVAIIPSVSYGLQIAANNLPLSSGGEILTVEDQFPSNVYPWREKAKACGGQVTIISRPGDDDWTSAVLRAIGPNTQIIAIPATHWADGGIMDLASIGMAARAAGAALVLDLTQSLGAMPFDIEIVRPDFMVTACYKWLMGPYSLGFVYCAPKHHNGTPLEHNWMNRAGSEDFTALVNYRDDFQPGARRFDMGEKANPAQLMAASAGLSQLLAWGVDNISETLGARNQFMAKRARALGLRVAVDQFRSPHYVSLGFGDGIPDDFAQMLAAENIFVSVRGTSVRVTPHLYNTDTDIDRLFDMLHKVC